MKKQKESKEKSAVDIVEDKIKKILKEKTLEVFVSKLPVNHYGYKCEKCGEIIENRLFLEAYLLNRGKVKINFLIPLEEAFEK